jgi:hypothetical protein
MGGAPHSGFATLISRMSRRSIATKSCGSGTSGWNVEHAEGRSNGTTSTRSSPVTRCQRPGSFTATPDGTNLTREEPDAGNLRVRIWCSEASCHSSGCKSRQQRSPSHCESLEVKAPDGRAYRSDPYRGASNLAGRSKCVNREAPKDVPRVKRIAGRLGVPSRSDLGEGDVGIDVLDHTMSSSRGHRERHAKKEWPAKARNHPRVA